MEETICPIDAKFPEQVAALLKPLSPREVQEYFVQLVATRQCHGLTVKPNAEYGKGVYSDMNFGESDLVLKDQMLVGIQHSSNKIDCLVCSFCFCFIGSVELQIGRKLYLRDLGVSANLECDRHSQTLEDCCLTDLSDGEDCSYVENNGNLGECSSSSPKNKIPLPKEVIQSLIDGGLKLTYTKEFPLPPVISCPGGCKEAYYCSTSCAEADWNFIHSLLCTGEKSKSICKEALSNFIQHANETNDIFLLAAKVISFTILKYRKMKEACLEEQKSFATNDCADGGNFPLLFEAWKPISMGYKRRWWDCIALPDDIDSNHEDSFRMEIRDLAFKSLQFLKAAIFDKECAPLFSLEIYGNIIGMFELNNLDLVVVSPVEDYFLYIDDLPQSEKTGAKEITQPFLDALGDEYSVCCQGTAFYPLQSCMNHSCHPNAKAFKREEDRDGQAIIVALQPICKGEEVTISYIDEDLPFKERQRLLADYGFRCRCQKCLEEEYGQD